MRSFPAPVAHSREKAYRRPVNLGRCLSLLLAFALLVGPAAMPRAMAMGPGHQATAAAPGHCAERQAPVEKKALDNCCVVACAAIPAVSGEVALRSLAPAAIPPLPRLAGQDGLHPAADPPPPRFS